LQYQNFWNMAMYDNDNTVKTSFDLNYVSEYLIQAQWAELIELKKVITELFHNKQSPISILDIGIGNARIAKHLSGVADIWDMIDLYDGTDNAQACVNISNEVVAELGIGDKVNAYLFEATQLDQWQKKYDLVICTWFTPGNFYPEDFSFKNYHPKQNRLNLDRNPNFETIFSNAYKLLNPNGEIVLGACYLDNNATRLKQEASYKKMGMTVITDEFDSFTATKEGFWSQRFTTEKLYQYLSFAEAAKIKITSLDTYKYAVQVMVFK
jgi:Methyltransferase domain